MDSSRSILLDCGSPIEWNHPLNQGLMAHYLCHPQFAGGAKLHDLCRPGDLSRAGTLTNMAAPFSSATSGWQRGGNRPGGFGAALAFDGTNNYVAWSNLNFGFNGRTAASIGFWIKTSDTTGRVFQKQISDGWNTILVDFGTTAANKVTFSVQSQSLGQFPTWSGAAIDSGWHHCAFSFAKNAINSADAILLVDGKVVPATYTANSYASSFAIQESANNLLVGVRPVTFADPFAGQLDDIRVYGRALAASEWSDFHQSSINRHPGLLRHVGTRTYFLNVGSVTTYPRALSFGAL